MRRKKEKLPYAVFLVPVIIYLIFLSFYPMINLLEMSVSKVAPSNIVHGTWPFVGFSNFARILKQSDFAHAFGHTLVFVVVVVGVGMIGGLISAAMLQRTGKLSKLALSFMVFTWAMPPVVLGSLWKFLLLPDGLVNAVILGLHATRAPILWLIHSPLVLVSVALVNSWAVIPFTTMVYRAAMIDIPIDLIDAASIDGANTAQRFFFVKLPLLMPITLILAVLTIVYAFRSFDFIYVMTKGGPGTASTTLPYLSYIDSFVKFEYSSGATVAVITILVVAVLAFLYVRTTRNIEEK